MHACRINHVRSDRSQQQAGRPNIIKMDAC